jgi:hypothetical protein
MVNVLIAFALVLEYTLYNYASTVRIPYVHCTVLCHAILDMCLLLMYIADC